MTTARAQLRLGPAWVQAVKPGLTRGRTAAWRLHGAGTAPGLRILFYHRIADTRDPLAVSPSRFRAQMAWLEAAGRRAVDLAEAAALLARGDPGDGVVGLCFDDGYRDVAENALGVLERHGFRATVFVVPGVVDGTARFTWYARQPRVLSWDEITRLDGASPLSFEAHTLTHPNLRALPPEDAEREIGGSKVALEARLGRPVTGFCYPAGVYGARERSLVAAAGFTAATTCEPGANLPGCDPLVLRRTAIDPRDRLADFRAKVEGGFDHPSRLRAVYRRTRLVPRAPASAAR
jgi:peptidoglycan/xylan/chitin deacetylase (PgdA/CDA1 family)